MTTAARGPRDPTPGPRDVLTRMRLCACTHPVVPCVHPAVLENGRVMPEPTNGQVIKWIPQTPACKFNNVPAKFSGPAGKAKAFSVDLEVLYDYGEAGYKDVAFSYSTSSAFSKIVTGVKFSGDESQSLRKMAFSVNHPKSGKKETRYYVDVKITSKKYKLASTHRFVINYKVSASAAWWCAHRWQSLT